MDILKVGVTGGIGSGKSLVCRLFSMLGRDVYDSDSAAKRIMVSDEAVVKAVSERFGAECYGNGELDRAYLASKVFGDKQALYELDAIVHPAVMEDCERWVAAHAGDAYVLVESAILFESPLAGFVDTSVAVSAPEFLRLRRAIDRDNTTPYKVKSRMANQMKESVRIERADHVIVNDEEHSLWEQVLRLDEMFRNGRSS